MSNNSDERQGSSLKSPTPVKNSESTPYQSDMKSQMSKRSRLLDQLEDSNFKIAEKERETIELCNIFKGTLTRSNSKALIIKQHSPENNFAPSSNSQSPQSPPELIWPNDTSEQGEKESSDEKDYSQDNQSVKSSHTSNRSSNKSSNSGEQHCNIISLIPIGLMILMVAILAKRNRILEVPFCNSDLVQGDPCALTWDPNGVSCRVCPAFSRCKKGKIVSCNEGFKLVSNQFCIGKKDNPMIEPMLTYLLKMDVEIKAGKTFESFGAERKDMITGSEIIENELFNGNEGQLDEEQAAEMRTQARDALGSLQESFTLLGNNRFCMQERFSVELMGNAFNFTDPSEVYITSLKPGPPEGENQAEEQSDAASEAI